MSAETADTRARESNPARDKAKLGDARYGVTPPREKIESPQTSDSVANCSECNKQLGAGHPYRADGEEYAYHFCDADCHGRWRVRHLQPDDPRVPKT